MNLSFHDAPPEILAFIVQSEAKSKPQSVRGLNLFQSQSLSTDDVRGVLSQLDPDCGYDEWVQVGMALHSGGYPLSLWDDWSRRGHKYQAGECERKWSGFNGGGGITMGTLVHMAERNGRRGDDVLPRFSSLPEPPIKVFPVHHWSELHTLPKRQYLIKGLLDCGGMSVVYGASNSGKTFLALDISCHIGLGWEWRGRKIKSGAVVYISGEGGLGVQERLEAFRQHHALGGYGDVYIIPACVPLNKEQSEHEALIQQIRGIQGLRLVVVDTLARAMGSGDENTAADMGAFISHCDAIREATGAHVLVVHHTGKDESRGARGSSALKAATDTEIHVSQSQGIISAEITKQRDGRTGDVLCFTLQPYCVGTDEDGEPVWSCAMIQAEHENTRDVLSGQSQKAFQVLCNLVIERGVDHSPKKGMRPQRVVRLDDFRTDFFKAGIATTDKTDSVEKAFHRAKEKLKDKGYIGEWDGYIWLTDKKDKTGQTGFSILAT